MKRYLILATIVAAVALGACAKESALPVATGKGTVRAINTIPASPRLSFMIEERLVGNASYKSATSTASYDDLEYTFNFEFLFAGEVTQTRVASQLLDVVKDKDYTFVVSGTMATPDVAVWETDIREWDGTETVFEARIAHTAASLGDVDVYFADPSIPPALGSQLGTLAFGEFVPTADYEAGDYLLTITPAGDDTTILFVSLPVTFTAQTQILISVFDGDANNLSPLAVNFFSLVAGGGNGAMVDPRFPTVARFLHASLNLGAVDIYVDDPLTVPLVTNHVFFDVTADFEVSAGVLPFTYTTAGNIGSILIDTDRTAILGARTDFYLLETSAGDGLLINHFADRRSIATRARFSLINTVASRVGLDVYLVLSGESIDEANALYPGLPTGTVPIQLPIAANSYDIYVTDIGEKIPLAGPISFDAALGDVFESIIYETTDPNVVDFVFLPLP